MQLEEFETPEHIFSDYAYFSSYSSSWLEHCQRYAELMIERFGLDGAATSSRSPPTTATCCSTSTSARSPCSGSSQPPTSRRSRCRRASPRLWSSSASETATSLAGESSADLLLGNNVLAHVPDLNDFVAGMKILLKPGGVITMEFPHLMSLIDENQWDTIYHEHFSYFSFLTVSRVFEAHGLRLFDVEELPTHGGSLRIYGVPRGRLREARDRAARGATRARARRRLRAARDLPRLRPPRRAPTSARSCCFLIDLKEQGLRVAGYGAPAKGNTLLNYCGLGRDFIDYTCDLNPHKQGHFLPGSHIPIRSPEALREDKPDVVLILPWNLKDEIIEQLSFIREWGGRFAARTPELTLLS